MVKLDDVAKLAGVSKGTASRVLNNRGYISQQTRERIEAAVKELNYYPNENARNLLKRRSGMIGVVVPTITYPYYSEMISFLEKFLKASGYKILLCNTSFSSGASQDYIKLLNNNRVDGAIIFNYKLTEQDYASLSFPIVSIDRHIRDEASYVASDHVQGGHTGRRLSAALRLPARDPDRRLIRGRRTLEYPPSGFPRYHGKAPGGLLLL